MLWLVRLCLRIQTWRLRLEVFLGLCTLSSKKANQRDVVIRCWCHEIQRVHLSWLICMDRGCQKITSNCLKRREIAQISLPCKECQVFGDRLTDNQDSKWMTSQIKRNLAEDKCSMKCLYDMLWKTLNLVDLDITLFMFFKGLCGRWDRPFGRQLRGPIRVMSQVEGVVSRWF